MKNKTLKYSGLTILPAALLLTGCWTNPYDLKPSTGSPAFVGGMVMVNSSTTKATVESVDISKREVVLKRDDGVVSTNVVGPEVVNLDKVKAGDTVRADMGSEVAIFVTKNGPVPSAGAGVLVAGAARGENPSGLVVATHDFHARVIQADRSYRLLTLKYDDGSVKTFKIPLPFTLEHVGVGDDVVVRTSEQIALKVVPQGR